MTELRVIISKDEYLSLLKDSHELASLEATGVDNWGGFDFCYKYYQNLCKEKNLTYNEKYDFDAKEIFEEFLEKQIMK